jgi:sugar transferase (PEP-CTERM/EpsH1 system associated)
MNILFLTHRFPHPPNKGDRIRSYHLLKKLASIGTVHLGTFADEPVKRPSMDVLRSLTARAEIVPGSPFRWWNAASSLAFGRSATEGLFRSRRLQETLRRWTSESKFDCGIAFCSSMAPYLEPLPIPLKFVDLVDVDSEKFRQYAAKERLPKRFLYSLEGRRLQRLERRIGDFADRVVLATAPEADLYRSISDSAKVASVPNGVDFEYFSPSAATPEPDSCVFVGAMDYRPNIEGVQWFADHVWAEIRQRRPNAVFRIVGRNPPRSVQLLSDRPGIEVTGETPDVRPYLSRSMVAVAPLQIARGVQNKVLEAMAAGRPVLASAHAAVGLQVAHDSEILIADEPAEWADRLVTLFDDDQLRSRIAAAGRRYVEANHAWDACLSPWREWLTAGSSKDGRRPTAFAAASGIG